MANFKQHLTGGAIAGGVIATIAIAHLKLDNSQGLLLFMLTLLGSIMPDVDCETSKPIRIIFNKLGLLVPMVLLYKYRSELSMELMIIYIIIGAIVIQYFIKALFIRFTVHRGIVHSIPAGIIYGELIFYIFHDSNNHIRVLFASVSTIGFFVHLLMDEFWSIDTANLRIKRSFGTAFTLFDKSKLKLLIAYIVLIALAPPLYKIIKEMI